LKLYRLIFQRCIEKLEKYLLKKLTPKRSLPCDSHPQLCKCCHAFRTYIKIGRKPPFLYINTKRGIYFCKL